MDNREPKSLNLDEVLNGDVYMIPVYQRNYDWGDVQIRQLIRDILDYAEQRSASYYIGSLIVHENSHRLEVLDGQQRLTTINLLALYLKHRLSDDIIKYEKVNLDFESRCQSVDTIHKLYEVFCKKNTEYSTKNFSKLLSSFDKRSTNSSIVNGFKSIDSVINDIFKNDSVIGLEQFASYLMSQVKILSVRVPRNTDVTHYFEVMNNRGEQLEKHEIVKANLLSAVKSDKQAMAVIQKVWLVCSDMSRYIQTGFSVSERKVLFGENAEDFKVKNYKDLTEKVRVESSFTDIKSGDNSLESSLNKALELGQYLRLESNNKKDNNIDYSDEGEGERFTSVIDFPNFLMQVLRIFIKIKNDEELPVLDDKDLINSFKKYIGNDQNEVKSFIFTLLKLRYLFDKYIIKREKTNKGEGWALKRYKYDGNQSSYVNTFSDDNENRSVNLTCLMLLSAFHVSYPTNSRKNWLAAVLYWLDEQYREQMLGEHSGRNYLDYLENISRAFIINRYLKDESVNYLDFIYLNENQIQNIPQGLSIKERDLSVRLSYGQVAIFVFNYLDYLLWKDSLLTKERDTTFRFGFNNSIEHFSPQNSRVGESLDDEDLHDFGNLCLISSSENSLLSNDTPEQKVRILRDRVRNKQISQPSLKLQKMMKITSDGNKWDVNDIRDHGGEMLCILKDDLCLS